MMKSLFAAILLSILPARGGAAAILCDQLTTGMRLCLPRYGTDFQNWARADIAAMTLLNSSSTINSTSTVHTADWLMVHRISGLATGTVGVQMSSYTWFTSSVTVAGGGGLAVTYGVSAATGVFNIATLAAPETSGATRTGAALRIKTNSGSALDFGQSGADPFAMWMQASDPANLASNTKLSINPNGGNVGIGTLSPNSKFHCSTCPAILDGQGAQLKVETITASTQAVFSGYSRLAGLVDTAGQIQVGDNQAFAGVLQYSPSATTILSLENTYDDVTALMKFRMRTNGTPVDAMTIVGSGKIGIGTSSPDTSLHVVNATSTGTTISGFSPYTSAASAASGALQFGVTEANAGLINYADAGSTIFTFANTYDSAAARMDFAMRTNPGSSKVTVMSILGSGLVGIGLVGPTLGKLHVENATANIYAGYFQSVAAAGSSDGLKVIAGGNATDTAFIVQERTEASNLIKIDGAGNIEMGRGTTVSTFSSSGNLTIASVSSITFPTGGGGAIKWADGSVSTSAFATTANVSIVSTVTYIAEGTASQASTEPNVCIATATLTLTRSSSKLMIHYQASHTAGATVMYANVLVDGAFLPGWTNAVIPCASWDSGSARGGLTCSLLSEAVASGSRSVCIVLGSTGGANLKKGQLSVIEVPGGS